MHDNATPDADAASNPLLDAALCYASRGWAVFPVHTIGADGRCDCRNAACDSPGKHPRTSTGFKAATTDRGRICGWWGEDGTFPQANIGIGTGASGLLVLDIDPRHGGDESLAALVATHGPLPDTPCALTGGGGQHFYFRNPGGVGNSAGMIGAGLDTRGVGGYVVAPPSGHASGGQYDWEASGHPDDVSLADPPDWLVRSACGGAGDAGGKGAGGRGAAPGTPDAPIPQGSRNETLFRDACRLRSLGVPDEAIAATVRHWNTVRCQPPLGGEEVEAIVANALRYESGVTRPVPLPPTVGGHRGRDGEGDERTEEDPSEPWEAPVPLDRAAALPTFPTGSLPDDLAAWVAAEAEATQTPTDLAGLLTLAALAAAVAKKAKVLVRDGWAEPLNLYTEITLGPANRKTQVFRDVMAPIVKYERDQIIAARAKVEEAQSQYRRKEKALKIAEDAAAREDDPIKANEAKLRADCLARELAELQPPVLPRLVADDVTPEKLKSMLAEQSGRMAVLSAEGGPFGLMAGRYSKNGTPNFEVYLKGHSGDDIAVDRRGRDSEWISEPAVTLGLAVQPAVLRRLAQQPAFRGQGLLARFWYSLPVSLVGRRRTDAPPVPAPVREAYEEGMQALLKLPMPKTQRWITFAELASDRFRSFERWLEPQLAEFGDLGDLADWAGKLPGAVARVAGLLHYWQFRTGSPRPWEVGIDLPTVEAAIAIGEYLSPHARAAFALMGADPAIEDARHILGWITKHGHRSFTKRDLFEGTKGRFGRVERLEPGLLALINHGNLRVLPVEATAGPGRKASPTYEVNPACFAHH